MKKFCLLFILLLIPITSKAYDLKCPSGPYNYGDTFDCYVTGNNTINYDEFSGTVNTGATGALTCSIEELENGMETVSGDDSKTFFRKGLSSSEQLVKITCEVTGEIESSTNEQLMIPNLKYHVLDSNLDASNEVLRSSYIFINSYKSTNSSSKPRDTSDPNVRLKIISDDNLDFTFSSFKTVYDISVLFEVTQLNIQAIPNNESSIVEIQGNQNLEIGDNVIDIYVTGTNGNKLCYTLNIKRLKRGEEIYYAEKDSSLSKIEIEGHDINFESIILDYNINIKHDVNDLKVRATPTVETAHVDISNTHDLKNGDTIEITVTSVDKSSKTVYMLHIIKEAPPKDYRSTIYIGLFVVAIVVVIIVIIITNNKNKNNPLLKKKASEMSKEEIEAKVQDALNAANSTNTINMNNTIKPIETTNQVDSNFNVATSNVNMIDLSNAAPPQGLTTVRMPDDNQVK